MSESRPLCGLPRAAAIGLLAQSLFYCWAELYGQLDRLPHWQGLTWREQHVWVQRATDVMTFLEPDPGSGGAHAGREILPAWQPWRQVRAPRADESHRATGDQSHHEQRPTPSAGTPAGAESQTEPAAVTRPPVGQPPHMAEQADGVTRPDLLFDLASGLARGRVLAFGDPTPLPGDIRD